MRQIDNQIATAPSAQVRKGEELATAHIAAFSGDAGTKIKTEGYYTSFKAHLTRTHKGKCAYCEAPLHRQHGDVEHFRPKGKVTNEADAEEWVTLDDGRKLRHPGYFWLAYDLDNLLLSCAICNQPNTYTDPNTGETRACGKRNRFPLSDPHKRACLLGRPIEEEDPLLVNPISDKIDDHLRLEPTGLLHPKSGKGEMTIRLLDLNRENLVQDRKAAIREARRVFVDLVTASNNDQDDEVDACETLIGAILREEKPYSRACWLGLYLSAARLEKVIPTFWELLDRIAEKTRAAAP